MSNPAAIDLAAIGNAIINFANSTIVVVVVVINANDDDDSIITIATTTITTTDNLTNDISAVEYLSYTYSWINLYLPDLY